MKVVIAVLFCGPGFGSQGAVNRLPSQGPVMDVGRYAADEAPWGAAEAVAVAELFLHTVVADATRHPDPNLQDIECLCKPMSVI